MTARQSTGGSQVFYHWAILAAVLLALGGLLAYAKIRDHQDLEREQRNRLALQAEVIERNLAPQLLLANRVIEGILKNLPAWDAKIDGFKHANHELEVINDTLIGIRPILIIRADGTVIASSNQALVGQSFIQREYFQTAIRNPDPGVLHVSAPFKTVLDTFVISLFRTIRGPQGEFAGIVIVSAAPDYFSTLLDSVRYAPDVRAAIIHGDGKVFLTSPHVTGVEGIDLARPGTMFTRHRDSKQPANVLAGHLYSTGEERMMALRTMQITRPAMDKTLVIAVSRDLQGIFAAWRQDAYIQGGLFAILTLVASLSLLIYQQRQQALNSVVAAREDERIEADSALRISEERYRLLVEESPLGITITQGGRGLYVNPALVEMIGYPESELVGKSFLPLIYEEDQSWVKDLHLRRMKGEQVDQSYVVRMVRKGGEVRHWQMKTRDIVIDGKPAALGIVSDISERIRMEADLTVARDAAEAASLTKTRFLAAASHDLRQPIQAINLFHDALARTDMSAEQRRISDYLARSIESLGDLLNALLDISKLDAGMVTASPEVVRVEALIHKINAEFAPMAAQKLLRFKLCFPFREMAIMTDGKLLMSLLGNLVGNALKYTPQGGILVAIRRRDRLALIQVWDTGIGIAPEHMGSIYEEYFQIGNPERDRTKGLGLGLAIAKRLARLLETEIVCRSRPGRGSVFEIRLPLADTAAMVEPGRVEAVAVAPDTSRGLVQRRIVVVEDDAMVAAAIQLSLESLGTSVRTYGTAEEALADSGIADADFYISDFRLPGRNGVEFLDAIAQRSTKPVRAVLLTGDTSSDRIEMTQSASWPVLFKPIDLAQLLATIEAKDT